MKTESLRNLIAGVVLVGVFAYSAWHVFSIRRAEQSDEKVTIRVGHWLMHAGMREAFDEAIAEYAKIRPDVRVEQIPVPLRTYPAWTRTRLIGGTAPD
nr:carbohydrate ABC transporter substrate-binding protein [Opitutaceae bacterium]